MIPKGHKVNLLVGPGDILKLQPSWLLLYTAVSFLTTHPEASVTFMPF